ncbi:hypothetical protein KC207_02235 [Phycicoccus sp. BSK3Z-2]|uniref:Uncharacterized protein n=1 Tax=Phycicoccus avicenniae TaxID=2828860 RepID=A0A941D7B0_9MICO|nr:hypothetical protein [Phycicoccus avicenniae]MBR7742110.1 hypothetical protein [Phycicoccus avicenniae]
MTRPALLVGAAVVVLGTGYAVGRIPVVRRFVGTVRSAAAERESALRSAVETAVRTDATVRAPRHAAGSRVPDLGVRAGWDRDGGAVPPGEADPGRSLTPDQARDLLLDPAGRHGAGRRARRGR